MRLILVLFFLLIPIAIGLFAWQDYRTPGPLTQEKTVVIPRGSGFRGAVDMLTQEGVITHPLLFKAMTVATGNARDLKAGEYLFPAGIAPNQVVEMLVSGKVMVHKLTVPEGWRVHEILEMLNEETALSGTISAIPAEGSLLPETYYFLRGDVRQEIVGRMRSDMTKLLTELWPKHKEGLPFTTIEQALTLASIVEKETGLPQERPRIAAVFVNRLKKNMPLQSDPTVQYAIEKDKGPLGRDLLTADLKYDSPFNTYKYAGLPPTPICNPGRASLAAVLSPPDTNELYFVATGNGGHNFAASLKEHNANVKKYREELKKQK